MRTFLARFTARDVSRWALVLAALYIIGWMIVQALSALIPFIFGAILAYLFLPLVNRFNPHMPRWAAILLVYLIVLGLVATFFAFLVPPLVDQVGQLIRAIPDIQVIQRWVTTVIDEYEQLLANLPEGMRDQVRNSVTEIIAQAATTLRTNFISYVQDIGNFLIDSVFSVVNTVSFLLGFFLIPFWLFYVLMDQREGRDKLDQFLPRWIRTDFWTVLTIIDYDFSGYLRGQLLLGAAVGSAAGVGLLALNLVGFEIPYVLLLAVIAGVTELVPIIGPILGSIPAILLGFLDSPTTGIAVLILYVVIQQLENNFLVPRIVGDSVGLHPAVLMILLVVGAQVFGIIGAILSAPVGAVARDIFSYVYGRLQEPPRAAGLLPKRMHLAGMPLLVIGPQTKSVPEQEAAEDDKEA
ncbi:AI-2E family transporter [Candidatus Chloroploca sp. Khr17]|uniref:AI-2E family transporter n=1 Tax=Candidatus Chloroploca sp. Khr17 TaxID=2496869 RepID=UPI00101D1A6A|nr:AI-2E family transporter [Candidatus Chloroploca sp. Khr17]